MTSFVFVMQQMMALGLEGTPYVDTRTFDGWLEVGRCVRRGEKSRLFSFTFIGKEPKAEAPADQSGGAMDENRRLYPKTTYLFHISQTDPIQPKEAACHDFQTETR